MFRFIASLEIQVIYDFYSAVILEERESYIGYIREIRIYMSQRNEMCDDFHQMDFFLLGLVQKIYFFISQGRH